MNDILIFMIMTYTYTQIQTIVYDILFLIFIRHCHYGISGLLKWLRNCTLTLYVLAPIVLRSYRANVQ